MFSNALFPTPRLIHDMQKEVTSPVGVTTNGNVEYRLKKQRHYQSRWRFPARLVPADDLSTLANFYVVTCNQGLNSFKFKDPSDCTWNLSPLIYTGAGNKFYVTKSNVDLHPIFHTAGDVVIRSGATTVSGVFSVENGVPIVTVAGYTSGLTISGTYYHCARFDQQSVSWALAALNSDNTPFGVNLGDISLVELFEY